MTACKQHEINACSRLSKWPQFGARLDSDAKHCSLVSKFAHLQQCCDTIDSPHGLTAVLSSVKTDPQRNVLERARNAGFSWSAFSDLVQYR